jgi:hypothetical protein
MFGFQGFQDRQGIDFAKVKGSRMSICSDCLLKLGHQLSLGLLGDGIPPNHGLLQNGYFCDSLDLIAALYIVEGLLRNPLLRTAGKN